MIQVDGKEIDILEAEWDILLVLDGCRYDLFEKLYKDILCVGGVLKQAKTYCSRSQDWSWGNFSRRDCSNIIYINPTVKFNYFYPDTVFHKVVNVWETRWDYTYGTILPDAMTDVAIDEIKKNPTERMMVLYHQPHPPYLLPEFVGIEDITTPEKIKESIKKKKKENCDLPHFIQGNMRRFLGPERAWRWMNGMNLSPLDYAGRIYTKYGMDGLKRGYMETLKLALYEVNRLIESNKGKKMIITSDHSKNFDDSLKGLKDQYVPWMEIV